MTGTDWASRVLLLHGGPVIRRRLGRVSATDEAEDEPTVLAGLGLMPGPRLTPVEPLEASWGRARSVPGRLERLLVSLVVDAEFDPGLGFAVRVSRLQKAVGKTKPITIDTLLPYVADLRKALGRASGAGREGSPIVRTPPGEGGDKLALNSRVVRCDWFDVLAAERAARAAEDAYERAYFYSMAERAYVESLRLTPAEAVAAAREKPRRYLHAVVRKRWELRRKYVDALIEIGHVDSVVNEFKLWDELADKAARNIAPPGSLCSDEFFGLDPREGQSPPLEEVASLSAGTTTLRNAAARPWGIPDRVSRKTVPNPGDIISKLEKKMDDKREQAKKLTDAQRSADLLPRQVVEWDQVEALLTQIVHQLDNDFPPYGFLPQIVVALGRGGSVVAAALSEMLPCRTVGYVSVDRYTYEYRPSGGIPYIRGYDLPDRRGCRVLVCDDIVTSGNTVTNAVREVIRPRYPSAQIVVATLVLNVRARDYLKVRVPEIRWAAGIEVDAAQREEFWVDFCWRRLRRDEPAAEEGSQETNPTS